MIRNVLTHIGGVENYGILSILLFFTVFTGALLWALGLNRRHLDEAARLPLDDGRPAASSPDSNPPVP
jgi:cbb3-type cytochrome oxidase subunit 3